jgi:hypothetical protein
VINRFLHVILQRPHLHLYLIVRTGDQNLKIPPHLTRINKYNSKGRDLELKQSQANTEHRSQSGSKSGAIGILIIINHCHLTKQEVGCVFDNECGTWGRIECARIPNNSWKAVYYSHMTMADLI